MSINLYQNDLPEGLALGPEVAVDTETMGLNLKRDRLCLVQISAGDDSVHLIQFRPQADGLPDYSAPNLRALMDDPAVTKIFHFARFDIAAIRRWIGVSPQPVYCTKVASKLVRTFTDRHGLKDLCGDLLGVTISKQQQSSDWGALELSEEQLRYAAADVLYLHRLRRALDTMLEREGRSEFAAACFEFLPKRAELDLAGWDEIDIFAH
ncbi:MAG: ribonuclease D [Rhodovibrionaceae bacterium]|nr:ribonuclease D [Rhodovibrionaceae bacterium]